MYHPVKREVGFSGGQRAVVSLNNPVVRYASNPILSAKDVNGIWTDPALQVKTVHNAGMTRFGQETIMLFRSHLRCGMSVVGLARSANGLDRWRIETGPSMKPAGEGDRFAEGVDREGVIESESGGIEDPRITKLDDTYAITYSAYHGRVKNRVRVSLASTRDFVSFTRYGAMLDRDMRNVVIFSEPINGQYVALFRPNDVKAGDVGGIFTQIRIGYAADWRSTWNISDEPILKTGGGPNAFSDKIGPGAPPVKTKSGWLNVFHGVRTTMDGNPYLLGVALHDLEDPARIKVSSLPILFPSRADCRVDEEDYIHVPNVVFSCGIIPNENGSILIYYGGNDTVMNVAVSHEDVLVALCERYGQDPLSGTRLYGIGG